MVMRAAAVYQVAFGAFRGSSKNLYDQGPFGLRARTILMGASKSQQAQTRPQQHPTYGDVFNAQGELRDKPITPEDAARMRSVESATLGQTLKGGTAAKMQSAVDKTTAAPTRNNNNTNNNNTGSDFAAEPNVTLDEVIPPEAVLAAEAVDIDVTVGLPATGRVDVVDHPITIGEALEVAGENIGDKPVDEHDARIIQSAESRATGNAPGVRRVVAAEAQSAANKNAAGAIDEIPTVHDVLNNASAKMPIDKVVTHEDAARVLAAEQRNSGGVAERGGIAATLQSAADKNAASDFEPREGKSGRIPNV